VQLDGVWLTDAQVVMAEAERIALDVVHVVVCTHLPAPRTACRRPGPVCCCCQAEGGCMHTD